MNDRIERHRAFLLHPVHAVLVAGALPLFLGALLADWAYAASYQIQWTNFASWLIAGGLVLAGLALVWALAGLVAARARGGRRLIYFVVLLAGWILGFINALVHAKDAWAAMPAGLILSIVVTVLIAVAVALGFARMGDVK